MLCDRVAIIDRGRLLELDSPAALVRGLDAPDPDQPRARGHRRGASPPDRRRRRGRGPPRPHRPVTTRRPAEVLTAAGQPRRPRTGSASPAPRSRTSSSTSPDGSTARDRLFCALARDAPGLLPRPHDAVLGRPVPADVPRAVRRHASPTTAPRSSRSSRSARSRCSTTCPRRRARRSSESRRHHAGRPTRRTALREVRKGDADAVVTEDGDRLVVRYSQADQVTAARGAGHVPGRRATRPTSQRPAGTPKFTPGGPAGRGRVARDDPVRHAGPARLGDRDRARRSAPRPTSSSWRQNGPAAPAAARAGPHVVGRPGTRRASAWSSRWSRRRSSSASAVGAFGLRAERLVAAGRSRCVLAGTLAFLSIGLLAGLDQQDRGGRGRPRQLRRAADGVPVRLVLLARRGARVAAGDQPGCCRCGTSTTAMLDMMVRGQGVGGDLVPMVILLGFAAVVHRDRRAALPLGRLSSERVRVRAGSRGRRRGRAAAAGRLRSRGRRRSGPWRTPKISHSRAPAYGRQDDEQRPARLGQVAGRARGASPAGRRGVDRSAPPPPSTKNALPMA